MEVSGGMRVSHAPMGCLHNHTPRFASFLLKIIFLHPVSTQPVGIDWVRVQLGDTLNEALHRSAYRWFDRYFSETKDPGDNRTLLTPSE